MRPLSEATARISSHNFSRKYIALGRIVNQWNEVMGNEFANKAQPVKIHYRKATRSKEARATLDIATTSSYATILPYQKDLILERINQLFGNQWITDINFIASKIAEPPLISKKMTPPLTSTEKTYLSTTLSQIDDPVFKEKLENLGKAILTETRQ